MGNKMNNERQPEHTQTTATTATNDGKVTPQNQQTTPHNEPMTAAQKISKLDKLKKEREALERKIKELSAKQNQAEKKKLDRRKIIIGAWVIENRPELVENIIANLTREQDKKAFED